MDALVLLEQWQGEHERNELGLHQYAKQKDLLLRALKDRTIATQDLQEETVAIKKKTVESAGTSALQLQLIDQEEQEGQVLDGEISRLAEEMRLKEAELERRSVETKASVARPESPKRQPEACCGAEGSLHRANWPKSEQPKVSTVGATANASGDRGQVVGHQPAPATCGAPEALQGQRQARQARPHGTGGPGDRADPRRVRRGQGRAAAAQACQAAGQLQRRICHLVLSVGARV